MEATNSTQKHENCGNCKFQRITKDRVGVCAKYAPRPSIYSEYSYFSPSWPVVDDKDWCGEFEEYEAEA